MSKLPSQLASTCSAVLTAAMLAAPAPANATTTGVKIYSYAVKFLCEQENGTEVETTINIHNPSLTQNANYKAKIVVPGEGYYFFETDGYLRPDAADSIECDDFETQAAAVATVDITDFEGFIVVLSNKPLDVVGVYEVENESETEDVDVVAVQGTTQTVPWALWNNLGKPL